MNKQELIKHFEEMEYVSIHQMGKKSFIDLIEKLDEPQKPVVPQFVADEIEYFKKTGDWNLFQAMDYSFGKNKIRDWLEVKHNQETFARAWLDGYEVEKEKRYTIKFKNIRKETRYLKYDRVVQNWYFGVEQYSKETKIYHTRKEIEDAGFGWVFDCPGVKVEEVE